MTDYNFLKKAIITMEEAKKDFNSEVTAFGALNHLVKRGKIVRLKGGLYATVNPITGDMFVNRFEIATALHDGAYVAYHTAMEYYGLATQVYSDVHVITPKRYSPMTIDDLEYQFFGEKYNGGIVEYKRNAPIRITELERTVVDCIDRIDLSGGLEEVFMALSAINYCDEEKLMTHLDGYGKKVLYKKTGYLFSLLKPSYLSEEFYVFCKSKMNIRSEDIRENAYLPYEYNEEWKLYVPKKIINEEN